MGEHLKANRVPDTSQPPRISTPTPPPPVTQHTTLESPTSPPHLQPVLPLPLLPPTATSAVNQQPGQSSLTASTSSSSATSSYPSTRNATAGMVQKITPKHEIVSAAAAAACVAGAPGTTPKASASTRWQEKTSRGRAKGDREDWKKLKKIKVDKYDDFNEWVDGDATMRYRPKDIDARKHLSGWAMRNTNNHNKKVLKKSCLGVFLCSKSCRTSSGDIVTVRPATSDRARKKQGDKKCPRTGCDGKLYHVVCSGKAGYPVTHFWRVTDTVILFQSKGIHDHPRPDVVKTTSQAKMALLEYHRTHRHERPKEICKKVQGVHIHKSFNRVDRVARQLREVQNSEGPETGAEMPREHYSLRSHLRSMWSSGAARPGELDGHFGQGSFQNAYATRQAAYGSYYPSQPQVEGWTQYTGNQEDYGAAFQTYRSLEGQHAAPNGAGYHHQPAGYPYNLPLHASNSATTYDFAGYNGNPVLTTAAGSGKALDGPLDVAGVHGDVSRQDLAAYHGYPNAATDFGLVLTGQPMATGVELNPIAVTTELTSPQQGHIVMTPVRQPGLSSGSLKRPATPDLHSLQEAKQPRLSGPSNQPMAIGESSTIKLAEHTPSINIDLSNFSDIFDIPAGLGEEGLAGRPKTPVYQSLSPAVPTSQSDIAAGGSSSERSVKEEQSPSPYSNANSEQQRVGGTSSSVGSPASSVDSHGSQLASPSPPPSQSPAHPTPVLTTLNTHAPPGSVTVTTAAPAGPTTDQDGNFLDQLVSLYLGKEEKPISTLKNEFHVYTDSQSGQRTYAIRPSSDFNPAHHLPGSSSSSSDHHSHIVRPVNHGPGNAHLDYTWYERASQTYRTNAASNGLVPATESLVTPLMSGHFDFTTSITDYYNSQQQQAAAAAAAAAAATSGTDAPISSFTQSVTTTSASNVFGHVTSRHVF